MTNSHDDLHKIVTQKEKDRLIIDEEGNILDLVKEQDNFNADKHGMPLYAGDDSAPTRKWRAIRCDDHGRQEIHLSNYDHDEQFDFRNKDFDTGVGTEKVSLVGLALPTDGGAAIGGTAANPVHGEVTQVEKDRTVTGEVTAIPSGDMARKDYYDRNMLLIINDYAADLAYHTWTVRFTYTVPGDRSAFLSYCRQRVQIVIATATKLCALNIQLYDGSAWGGSLTSLFHWDTSPEESINQLTIPLVLVAGNGVRGNTYNSDTINHVLDVSAYAVEFDE